MKYEMNTTRIKSPQSKASASLEDIRQSSRLVVSTSFQPCFEDFLFKNIMSKFTVGAVFYVLYGIIKSEDLWGAVGLVLIAALLLLGVQS